MSAPYAYWLTPEEVERNKRAQYQTFENAAVVVGDRAAVHHAYSIAGLQYLYALVQRAFVLFARANSTPDTPKEKP